MPVNLELALTPSTRMGGHIVSGHVDGIGTVMEKKPDGRSFRFTVKASGNLAKYIAEKGSVALDGISLTVARVDDSSFDVSVIPHTLDVTTIHEKKTGNTVNVECDLIAKYLEKVAGFNRDKGNITLEFLAEQGFV